MSWLSGFSATARPMRSATARTAALSGYPPSGNARRGAVARRRGEEIGLVARRVGGAVQLRPLRPFQAPARNARCQRLAAQSRPAPPGRGTSPLVAADAGHRRFAGGIAVGEILDHPRRNTCSRSRRNAGCRACRPRPAHHGCPARRSRRPSSGPWRRGRRAAASLPPPHGLLASRPATTEETTPPDMATSTLIAHPPRRGVAPSHRSPRTRRQARRVQPCCQKRCSSRAASRNPRSASRSAPPRHGSRPARRSAPRPPAPGLVAVIA